MPTPLTDLEKSIAAKIAGANFPPATASKAFARNLGNGYIKELSHNGRRFMAHIAYRFRRQYVLTEEEKTWVEEWRNAPYEKRTPPVKQDRMTRMEMLDESRYTKLQEWEAIYGRRT